MSTTLESYVTSVINLIGEYLVATGNVRDNPTENVGAEYVNNVFEIRSYNWNDEDPYEPNFYFTEFGYSVDWYKHLGRGDESSDPLTIQQALYMLNRCLVSIAHNENSPFDDTPLVWDDDWEPDDDDDY